MSYNTIRLSEQLSEKHVIIHSSSENAEGILREMILVLSEELGVDVCEDILKEIWVREKRITTGIGHGVAVPHARTSLVKQLYCIAATSEQGIEFKASDGKPVFLFFLVITPEFTVGPHLNIISAIASLVGKNAASMAADFNNALSPDEFMEILTSKEEKYIS
ncbi:MAG: PTS sugar transporter subunit IIA [Fibromonadaceae bacterium]|jgi:mannitol/fructose-specific phosphotransferase system IIA component (Ntr-type)|nr:PTS sugar transporter subunit IIA [Fibromonadaceae bacterium]